MHALRLNKREIVSYDNGVLWFLIRLEIMSKKSRRGTVGIVCATTRHIITTISAAMAHGISIAISYKCGGCQEDQPLVDLGIEKPMTMHSN